MGGRQFVWNDPPLPSFPVPTKGEKNEVLLYVLRPFLEFRLESDHGIVPQQSHSQARADVRENRIRRVKKFCLSFLDGFFRALAAARSSIGEV